MMKLWRLILLLALLAGTVVTARADTNNIARGLAWLADQQRADGSWSTNVGLNALSMLAFLSDGHVPGSKPYGDRVEKGLQYILTHQGSDGTFTNGGAMMFGHGMTTLLLAELDGMQTRTTNVHAAVERAIKVIRDAQAVSKGEFFEGGWRYFPDSRDSDLAVTIWQVLALRSATTAGVAVPKESFEKAARYIKRCEHPRGGFAYQAGGFVNVGRTAGGIVALRLCGQFKDPSIERSRTWLTAHSLHWEDEYVYHSAFFSARVGFGFDESLLVKHQKTDGSWPVPPNSRDEAEAGPLYFTSMAVMALTAKQNALPVFTGSD